MDIICQVRTLDAMQTGVSHIGMAGVVIYVEGASHPAGVLMTITVFVGKVVRVAVHAMLKMDLRIASIAKRLRDWRWSVLRVSVW